MSYVRLPDGGRISVEVQGAGPPLLLLRPLGGSLASWGPFARLLASEARVIAFDPRGVGLSSMAPFLTTTRTMAADAAAVLDELAIERANAYGVSLGGMVASWLAIDAPARVSRLVLASTPIVGASLQLGRWRRAAILAQCLLRPGRSSQSCFAIRILSPGFRAAHPEALGIIGRRAEERPASYRGVLTLLTAAARHDVSDRLHQPLPDARSRRRLRRPGTSRHAARDGAGAADGILPDDRSRGTDVSTEAPAEVAELVLDHVHDRARHPSGVTSGGVR